MAYISAAEVKQIRVALKEAFPKFKFAVRKSPGGHAVNVDLIKGDVDFSGLRGGYQVNPYWLEKNYNEEQQQLLSKIVKIIKTAPDGGWYDRSDSMVDYFDTAFYFHICIGQWKKPYVKI